MTTPLEHEQAAKNIYEDALRHKEGGDDFTARRLVKLSLAQHPIEEAKVLELWLTKFGDGTMYDEAAKRILNADDFYAVFQLPKFSLVDDKEIHKRFLKQSHDVHPDRNEARNAKEAFQRLNEAKMTLCDPEKRERYDSTISWQGHCGKQL